jgi:hypothetical protein
LHQILFRGFIAHGVITYELLIIIILIIFFHFLKFHFTYLDYFVYVHDIKSI